MEFESAAHLDLQVERICNLGCAAVYRIIDGLERGEQLPELRSIRREDQARLLAELKAVMAVYDAREGGAACRLPP